MIYMITCNAITEDQRNAVQKALDADPRIVSWIRPMFASWLVETKLTDTSELRKIVHVGAPDITLVTTAVFQGTCTGWADKKVWEWLNKKELPAAPKNPDKPKTGDEASFRSIQINNARALSDYTGIDDIATRLNSMVAGFAFRDAATRAGLSLKQGYCNMLIVGSPGVGKTSLAQTAAVLLRDSLPGQTTKRKIHLVQAADLIDRHVGKSMNNTKALLDEAGDGVVIFDELDTVMKVHSYGQEVLNTINTHITHSPNKPVIIATIYGENERALRAANAGLASRLPHTIRMPGYDDDTLSTIFAAQAAAAGMLVEPAATNAVKSLLASVRRGASASFGNAREVENIFESVLNNIAARFAGMPDELKNASDNAGLERLRAAIGTITAADIPLRDSTTGALIRAPQPAPDDRTPPSGVTPARKMTLILPPAPKDPAP